MIKNLLLSIGLVSSCFAVAGAIIAFIMWVAENTTFWGGLATVMSTLFVLLVAAVFTANQWGEN